MRDDSTIVKTFNSLTRKSYLSIADAEALGREIGRRALSVTGSPDLVVGIANGALLPTWVVSDEIGRPFAIINVRRKGSRLKQRFVKIKQLLHIPSALATRGPMAVLWRLFEHTFYKHWPTQLEASSSNLEFDVQGKDVLLVDDCIVTGASVQFVHGQLLASGAKSVSVAAICLSGDSPLQEGDVGFPAVYLNRLVHFYPWSANHGDYDNYLGWLRRHSLKQWD